MNKSSAFYYLYFCVCVWVLCGVIDYGASQPFYVWCVHVLGFVSFVLFFLKIYSSPASFGLIKPVSQYVPGYFGFFLVLCLIGVSCAHWISLGFVPFFKAAIEESSHSAIQIRSSLTQLTSVYTNYFFAILVGAVLPFFNLFLLLCKDKLAPVFFALSLFFAICSLQRSLPLFLVFPSFIYFMISGLHRRAYKLLLLGLLGFFMVHFSLNGYFVRLSPIRSVSAGEVKVDADPWYAIKGIKSIGWIDSKDEFVSGKWHVENSVYFEGRRVLYKKLNNESAIIDRDFLITLNIKVLPEIRQEANPLLFIGQDTGYAGSLSVSINSYSLDMAYVSINLVNQAGSESFQFDSNPFKLNEWVDIVIERKQSNLSVTINELKKNFTFGVLSLYSSTNNDGVIQLGAYFGKLNRTAPDSSLDKYLLSDFSYEVYVDSYHKYSLVADFLKTQTALKSSSLFSNAPSESDLNDDLLTVLYLNIYNLLDRLFLIPGRTGAIWVDLIPKQIPFANGCGYKFLTIALSCDFVNFPSIIHQFVEPYLNEAGIIGTMNAAEMFNGYANFGLIGAFITGVALAVLMSFLRYIYWNYFEFGMAISFPYILMQSSSGLPVALFSGGWFFSIALFLIFHRYLPVSKVRL